MKGTEFRNFYGLLEKFKSRETRGVFNIKAVIPQLSINGATNPEVHTPTGECKAKPKRIWTLASEILLDVQEVKQQLMSRRRQRQAGSVAAKSSLSAKSMIKAKSIAASILNMSENDLADIMEMDQRTATCTETLRDQEWLDRLNFILQQK
ncbi:hypothetical protein ILYODFUR_013891, partial [Ilyodon furcidens]